MTAPISVLFVDDDPAVLRAIRRTLEGTALEVLVAFDAAEAVRTLEARPIDVLVSDIDMPEMDGIELVKLARRRFPATIRMLLTGQSTLTRALEAINEGEVTRLYDKPFDPTAFRRAIGELASRIERSRRDGSDRAHAAWIAALRTWMEERYPSSTHVVHDDAGVVILDQEQIDSALAKGEAAGLRKYLRRPWEEA